MAWPHGFNVRHIAVEPGTSSAAHTRAEEEVLLVHDGVLTVGFDEGETQLVAGDVLTVPIGKSRIYSNSSDAIAEVYVVRGGDHPVAAQVIV